MGKQIYLSDWEIEFIKDMADYEYGNTDGHSDEDYIKMSELNVKLGGNKFTGVDEFRNDSND